MALPAHLAHLDGMIDLLADILARELLEDPTTNEKPRVPGTAKPGAETHRGCEHTHRPP